MEKYKDANITAQQLAEALVSQMTPEEKASQLKYDAPAIERLGLPAYNYWNEGLHGVARAGTATIFPQAIALAAMFDCEALGRVADVVAVEARAKYNQNVKRGDRDIYKGITMWSPNINIFRDPRWGRGQETYGECPYLTSRLGVAFVKGLQGGGKYYKTAACAKHFAVHSGPEATRHKFDARASEKDINETYLPAFKALVEEARVEIIMGAYNRVNGEPACASRYLMSKLAEWGFDGHFISDCWAVCDFHTAHMVTSTDTESAALALKTGCDLNCGTMYAKLLAALGEGLITEDDITKAAVHVLRTRARLGMFDESTTYDDIPYDVVGCDGHKALSIECARKSMVLLKNNGLLPLDKTKIRSIGVIGPNSASIEALRGNYYGTSDEYVTFLRGIKEAFAGKVCYAEGCHLFKDRIQPLAGPGDGISEAITVALHSDAVVLCVGLDATIEGEQGDTGNAFAAGDKLDLLLPEGQRLLIEKVLEVGKPTVIVIAAGSPINPEAGADAIIEAWYPGAYGGRALADILFGEVSPSGKLPVTFYETAESLPPFDDYSMENRTYRYAKNNVLFPFGFGLTYSKVKCSGLKFDNAGRTASVKIKNIGSFDTDEVVQFYIRDNESKWAVPNHSLCGFARVSLKSGEEKEVRMEIPRTAFEVVDDKGRRFTDSGSFTLYAGVCQPDKLSRRLAGSECESLNIAYSS
jgi:beta-glucosidase